MKLLKIFRIALIGFIGINLATACQSDKDEPEVPISKTIAGTYKGIMECSVMGNVSTFENLAYKITSVDDVTVEITLPAFGEEPMAMPEIIIPGVKLTESDGKVIMTETEVSGQSGTGKNYTCTMAASIENDNLVVRYNLRYGAMPMPLICTATATKD